MSRRLAAAFLTLVGCAREPVGFEVPPPDGASVVDPVTRAKCPKSQKTPSAVYLERTYYFCASESAARFLEKPEKYADVNTSDAGGH